ncbi:hypothetical protein [Halomicrobium katesii]|uniref:hypothetical protein n=1 Tax=Halomicrobium katesii TaxID=437163 RepID=UPI0003622EDB|nr:hypothetical protein [Halomicrobium katesii]
MSSNSFVRYRGEVAIIVGFALLLNPLVVSAYDIGDPDSYRYESSEVEVYANGTYHTSATTNHIDSDVACFGDMLSRSCVLERAIHENNGITYDGSPRSFMSHDYAYVHIFGSGFFQPATTGSQNGTVRYGLEPVPQDKALDRIATPLSETSPGVRTAISQGKYVTSDELSGAEELVSTDEGYFVVYAAASSVDHTAERTAAVVALQWILGFTGAFLILRGQRRRVERGD